MKRLAPLAALLLLLQPIPVAAAQPPDPAQPPITVTLITGDRVSLDANGGIAIQTDRVVTFQTTRINGTVRVVPGDVAHLIGDRLDPQLFDIDTLARYRGNVPVITSAPAKGRRLASIAATVTPMSTYREGETVWLDAPVRADLAPQAVDRNLEQIGAPAAWAQGLTGQGIRLAVLDTGVDPTHPDLAGRVAELANFTESPVATDRHGHGTHVASVAAGQKGVAFGATLLSGKVLGDDGAGTLSDIIAGMEWAAGQGARVVNLSLSSNTPSTGADPLSRAVDALTAEHGTLFVTSAGNRGPDGFGIGAPGAADHALTVGAVDRHDRVASFSSRGPRAGDHAVKPDLTAPGVDITGARAAGTQLGKPVGAQHVRLSGTSMAAPHVAGGAALLAQHHPDWTAPRLKSALMGTAAAIGAGTFDTGSGRLALAGITEQGVIAQEPALSLGFVAYPQAGLPPARRTLSLVNTGMADATLDLSADAATVSPNHVTVPAGGTASVEVTVDLAAGGFGARSGAVKADGLRVPIGWFSESTRHVLRLRAVDRLGESKLETLATVINLRDITASPPDPVLMQDGVASVRVQPGHYAITSAVPTLGEGIPDPDDGVPDDDPVVTSVTIVTVAETAVFADTEVLLDARTGRPVSAEVEGETTTPVDVQAFVAAQDRAGNRFVLGYATSASDVIEGKLFVSPTSAPRQGTLQMSIKFRLDGVSTYDLLFAAPSFPSDMTYVVRRRDLARVDTTYRTAGTPIDYSDGRFVHTDINPVSVAIFQRVPTTPLNRVEYLTPGRGWHWFQCVNVSTMDEGIGGYCQPETAAKHAWLTAPLRTRAGVFRTPAHVQWGMDDLADGPNSGSLSSHTFTEREYVLYRNGIQIARGAEAFGSQPVPPGPATFRLTRTVVPRPDLLALSTRVETSWTFAFGRRDTTAPIVDVAVHAPVDEENTLPAGVPVELRVEVSHPGGRLAGVSLELSYDDGVTWSPVGLRHGTASPSLEPGLVSLRTSASDSRGNHTSQTVLRAFLVKW